MLLNCDVGEDSWESLGMQGDPTSPFWRRSVLNIHWKDWCWSRNSNTLGTWWEELTHLKRPWCWVRLRAGGEGDHRGWDGWMASPTQWTRVRVGSGVDVEQRGLVCCSLWGLKESDITGDWNELNWNQIRTTLSFCFITWTNLKSYMNSTFCSLCFKTELPGVDRGSNTTVWTRRFIYILYWQ